MSNKEKDVVENVEEVIEEVKEEANETEQTVETETKTEEVSGEVEENKEEKLQKESKEWQDKYQRLVAEFDNFRKRSIKEKQGMYSEGVKEVIEKMLPVVDNFERAFQNAENVDDSFYKGMDMILKQMLEVMQNIGVEEIKEEKFDPNLHHAVLHEENDQYEENTVIDVLQKGYKYKEKVIRCAMVKVAN